MSRQERKKTEQRDGQHVYISVYFLVFAFINLSIVYRDIFFTKSMATTETKTDPAVRETTGKWYFQTYWGSNTTPIESSILAYTQTLMNLAAADQVLADEERQWVLGNASAKGCSDETYNFIKTYVPTVADIEKMMSEKPTFIGHTARALLFEAFLAASADKELHKDERDAIYRYGQLLGEKKEDIEKLQELAVQEQKHRAKVVGFIFPGGLPQVIRDIAVDFKNN